MKRFIISFFLLTFLTIGIFAQPGPWKVEVQWTVTSSSTCQFQDLVHDRFLVAITIFDEANNVTVVNNKTAVVNNDENEYTFNVQQEVETHCNDTSLTYVPAYKIFTIVRMVNIQTQLVYCSEKDPGIPTNCFKMSTTGEDVGPIIFN